MSYKATTVGELISALEKFPTSYTVVIGDEECFTGGQITVTEDSLITGMVLVGIALDRDAA